MASNVGIVEFCDRHLSHTTCNGTCKRLHLCPWYGLGTCEESNCRRGGHQLLDVHNKSVLSEKGIIGGGIEEVRSKLSQQLFLHRSKHTTPKACKYGLTCRHKNNCHYLHICPEFLKQACKVPDCPLHDIKSAHNLKVFKSYAIDASQDGETLIYALFTMGEEQATRRELEHYERTTHPSVLKQSQRDVEQLYEEGLCLICETEKSDTVFFPCRHMQYCNKCVQRFPSRHCPTCRQPIQDMVIPIRR